MTNEEKLKKEDEVKEIIKEILKDRKSYKTTLKYALKYCRRALKASGNELKEACLYILGNTSCVYYGRGWDGERSYKLKEKLRRYAFRGMSPRTMQGGNDAEVEAPDTEVYCGIQGVQEEGEEMWESSAGMDESAY